MEALMPADKLLEALTLLPARTNERMLTLLPMCAKLKVEMLPPQRANALILKLDEMCTTPNTLDCG
jgi:hypothetical protein